MLCVYMHAYMHRFNNIIMFTITHRKRRLGMLLWLFMSTKSQPIADDLMCYFINPGQNAANFTRKM